MCCCFSLLGVSARPVFWLCAHSVIAQGVTPWVPSLLMCDGFQIPLLLGFVCGWVAADAMLLPACVCSHLMCARPCSGSSPVLLLQLCWRADHVCLPFAVQSVWRCLAPSCAGETRVQPGGCVDPRPRPSGTCLHVMPPDSRPLRGMASDDATPSIFFGQSVCTQGQHRPWWHQAAGSRGRDGGCSRGLRVCFQHILSTRGKWLAIAECMTCGCFLGLSSGGKPGHRAYVRVCVCVVGREFRRRADLCSNAVSLPARPTWCLMRHQQLSKLGVWF